MPVTVRSPLDVAFWFLGRGESSAAPLDALALQNLLYLAQARWAAASEGRKLMPATFLATDSGPIEPTIYHVFRSGPPPLEFRDPHADVVAFLDDVWERFGHLPAKDLGDIVRADASYQSARAQGANEEIVFAAGSAAPAARPAAAEAPVLATKDGVRATKWDSRPEPQAQGAKGALRRPLRQRAGQPRDQVHPSPPALGRPQL